MFILILIEILVLLIKIVWKYLAYLLKKMITPKKCFKCSYCNQSLYLNNFPLDCQSEMKYELHRYCRQNFDLSLFKNNPKLNKSKKKDQDSICIILI